IGYIIYISGSAWFNRCCSVTGSVDVRLRSSERSKPSCTSTHTKPKGVSVCAPASTPRLGRASAAAALPWRPQGAASSS
ncbi:hypothetical protein T492DRAFT_1106628, partial [Pavlovales sp. CCMP2436]